MEETDMNPLTVEISSNVIMKMISNSEPSGYLLGVPGKDELKVTDCFTLRSHSTMKPEDITNEMKKSNVDHMNVGTYITSSQITYQNIEELYTYQQQSPTRKSVLLVYNKKLTKLKGELYVKAYQLSDRFLEVIKEAQKKIDDHREYKQKTDGSEPLSNAQLDTMIEKEKLKLYHNALPASIPDLSEKLIQKHNLTWENMFDEYVVRIHHYGLTKVLLHQLKEQHDRQTSQVAKRYNQSYSSMNISKYKRKCLLDMAPRASTDRSLKQLLGTYDSYHSAQNDYKSNLYSALKRAQNYRSRSYQHDMKSLMNFLLVRQTTEEHSHLVTADVERGLHKIYIAKALQQKMD
mmetsp:Transcript_7198/g.10595  ORF Transcript_7198/g.10595 Transcript_7198/m.10595 type:complete len:348 (+) Transcript_7198:529-1572(+)